MLIFGSRTALEVQEAATVSCSDQYDSIELMWYDPADFRQRIEGDFASRFQAIDYLVGVADVQWKSQIVHACQAMGWQAKTVIHPTAVVSPSARLGNGVFIGPQAVVSAQASIGDHCLIHIHSSIGHDAQVGEWAVVLPGARVSGNVRLGNRVLVGSNAFINAGVCVGDDSQIDALTYVARDLPPRVLQSVRYPKPVPRVLPVSSDRAIGGG